MDSNFKPTKKSIVSLTACPDYQEENVRRALQRTLRNLGGLESWIRAGFKVHVKPNLLSIKGPDKAVTTHPMIVKILVDMLHDLGALVTIGDSPAGISRRIEDYWDASGMTWVSQVTGAELVAFENKGVVEKIIGERHYFIAKKVAEADAIINICKMKTHGLTLMTGSIKNMFGVIPGYRKSEFHKLAPKAAAFSEILVDIFESVKPCLNIMDAVVAMEGNGPSSGHPKKVGLILSSADAVALDAVAAHFMGFGSVEISTTEIAHRRGLGQKYLDAIEIRGNQNEQIEPFNFQLPSHRLHQYVPEFLVHLLGRLVWVRPRANADRCQRCGLCIRNCPVQAMKSHDGFPLIDYDSCIQCFCCDETCPHNAIEQEMSWLAKKFS